MSATDTIDTATAATAPTETTPTTTLTTTETAAASTPLIMVPVRRRFLDDKPPCTNPLCCASVARLGSDHREHFSHPTRECRYGARCKHVIAVRSGKYYNEDAFHCLVFYHAREKCPFGAGCKHIVLYAINRPDNAVLDHLHRYEHTADNLRAAILAAPAPPPCPFGKNCRHFTAAVDGTYNQIDSVHVLFYRH